MNGGWASRPWPLEQRLSHLPEWWDGFDDTEEPPYAVADAWEPPHPLALPVGLCERLLRGADACTPLPSGNGTYFLPEIPAADLAEIVERFTEANRLWWRLDVTEWQVGVKRYRVGERHSSHQDLHAGAARRKLAGVVQLVEGERYDGGDLTVSFAHHTIPLPRARGTLVAFPGWTVHEVTPITAGERWSLCVNGWGPPLR